MKIKLYFLGNLVMMLFNASISQAQYNSIYDVFSNEEFTYTNKYKEVSDSDLNPNKEFDINYFALRNTTHNFNKLNAQVEQLALNAWKNDKSKFDLQKEVKAVIANFYAFKNNKNSRLSNRESNKYNIIELKDLDIELIAICKDKITIKQNFKFIISSNEYNYNKILEIEVAHYFVADMYAQQINELKNNFNETELVRLKKTIDPYISKVANDLRREFNDEEREELNETLLLDEEDKEDDSEMEKSDKYTKNKISKKVDSIYYNEANYFWQAWGLIVEFPEYCKSSTLTNGLAFTLFIPYNHCKTIIDLFPQYAGYVGLNKPLHSFSQFNYFEKITTYNAFVSEPNVTSLFNFNNALDKPIKLTAKSYQTFKEGKTSYRGDFIFEFDIHAKNFQQSAAKTEYTHFLEQNNGKAIHREGNKSIKKDNFTYDEKGNLLLRKMYDIESGGDYIFFYNGNNCYYFRSSLFHKDNQEKLSHFSMSKGEICLRDVCLLFNNKMQVEAIKSNRNQQNETQLGYDTKDRLIEAHAEFDRYNYYYEYDDLDRLIKYSTYEQNRVLKEIEFFYRDKNKLPYLKKKHTYSQDTFEEETYTWEY